MVMRVWLGLLVAAAICAPSAMAQEAVDVRDASVTKRPKLDLERSTLPAYPAAAAQAGLEGEATIKACVGIDGRVTSSEVGVSSGHGILDQATIAWLASEAKFQPAESNGAPVAVCNHPVIYAWTLEAAKPQDVLTKVPALTRETKPPEFPRAALRLKKAESRISLCLDVKGKVLSAKIVTSSGEKSLDDAAIDWLMDGARFSPAEVNGAPRAVCGYEFTHVWQVK